MLLHPKYLRYFLPRAGIHPLLLFRHIFMHTHMLLSISKLHKSKHLCAIWMCPALKFELCYQSWIMITNIKIRFKRRFYVLSYHSRAGTIHRFGVAAAKRMFWFSALGVSSLQLIFLFQLLLWVDKIYFNIFVRRVLSREREVFPLLFKTIAFICTIHLTLVHDIARSPWWNYGSIIIAL